MTSFRPARLATIAFLLCTAPAAKISWAPTYQAALDLAAQEGRVIFVAVHMPGERGNERMAKSVYGDKRITEFAESTVNLIGISMDDYRKAGSRVSLGKLNEEQLTNLSRDINKHVLKPNSDGSVVAPQHVFLDSQGAVLLSVPWEVTANELEWCFATALSTLDPEHPVKPSSRARAPRRLLVGRVLEPRANQGTPATLEEVREIMRLTRKGGGDIDDNWDLMLRIMTADEEVARSFISQHLRGAWSGAERTIHAIALASSASWWEVVAEFNRNDSETVREEVAACLEQLAAADSLKSIKTALSKEKDERLKGNWLRAYASAGADDGKVRKAVFKAVDRTEDVVGRANAILALGYLTPGEDLDQLLGMLITDAETGPEQRTAAICAMALTRRATWTATLTPLTTDGPLQEVAQAALQVLEAGDLTPLRPFVISACGDVIDRERLFGRR